jgi:hypothetical protein
VGQAQEAAQHGAPAALLLLLLLLLNDSVAHAV